MPGLYSNETGRFIGDYKFGCGVETVFAKQIARPSDLEGRSEMGMRDARRDSVILENYSSGAVQQPLDGIDRSDLAAE
jgi:type IV pilus biogenesis protein CpaD/CtpE